MSLPIEIRVRCHSRSWKVVPFDRSGAWFPSTDYSNFVRRKIPWPWNRG